MSLLSRLRQHFPTQSIPKPYISSLITSNSKTLNPSWVYRNFAQAAIKEEQEIEEIEIDPKKLPADYDPSNFDPGSHRKPPTDRVFRLVDEVSSLTLIECSQLASIMMNKMGMSEPPVMGVLKPGAAAGLAQMSAHGPGPDAGPVEKVEEKTVFELKLEGFDAASKIKVIKEIRGCTDLGLKEAKELVEKAPAVFKTGVAKEEAEKIVEKLKAVGAKVAMV